MMKEFDNIQFFYPPKDEEKGTQFWHPYTPVNEPYDQSQRAHGYDRWITTSAAEVWKVLDKLEEDGEDLLMLAFSNGGAIGVEASLYSKCIGTFLSLQCLF